MPRTILGSLVGALAVTALAAPLAHAAAKPANVTVRVEGPRGSLVLANLRTTTTPVVKDGDRSHACAGTSAAGALEQATDGRWDASYFRGLGYAVDSINGLRGGSPSEYWTLWLNDRSSMTGLCDTELQNGDELLVFLCRSGADYSCANRPLGLVVPTKKSKTPTVQVVTFKDDGSSAPAAGATVTGGTRVVRTDAQGRAKVTLGSAQSTLVATRPGDVGSAPVYCSANACGSRDTTAPAVAVKGIRDGQSFAAAKAPRALRGTAADPAGAIVELRLTRSDNGTCTAFDFRREAFSRCPKTGAPWFQASDRRNWSYLLPERLAPGRYSLGVLATDPNGNSGKQTVRFTVKAAR